MQIIKVIGLASGTVRDFTVTPGELNENLLKWLRRHGITVASSCDGEEICKKCVMQNNLLTCSFSVQSFLEFQPDGKIEITYL